MVSLIWKRQSQLACIFTPQNGCICQAPVPAIWTRRKAVNHTNLIFLKEPLAPVKVLSTIVDVVLKQPNWYYLCEFVLQLDQFKQGGLS